MTNRIPDQNVIKAAALEVVIEYAKVLKGIAEMISVTTSALLHSATASARADGAMCGFNIRAGTTSTL
jgi:hypothetical protein